MTPNVTSELIRSIKEKSSLKQFELAETELSQDDIEMIGEFISKSRQLEELELRDNYMVPRQVETLMEYIHENKRLVHVNLSRNNMMERFGQNNLERALETEKKVKEQLYSFFRGNKKLIHIDLTSTNLSEVAILHIIPAIKRSKSLQGVHLSGNPGVTVAVKKEAR